MASVSGGPVIVYQVPFMSGDFPADEERLDEVGLSRLDEEGCAQQQRHGDELR